ncbi:AAA family ATPase [Halobacterium sp. KA-6]|uniref:AAA family ATPase n=1 Tax=Halobacterium sp. KA-6 TaxID=2896368 RepID=UPI001E54108C|nr:AAA family ATPase [Halobacterium sp. KA-6]MCD2204537.1 AAA family ATPase [Halobacterium sp. KA-6]
MADTRVFLAPCSNADAQEHLERTVLDGVPESTYGDHTSINFGESVSIWGGKEGVEGTWKQVSSGDYLLYYTGGSQYTYAVEVLATEENADLAEALWPGFDDTWKYIFYLGDPIPVDISSEELHGYAGYGRDFPLGLQPLNEEGLKRIRDEFGSVSQYIETHRTDADSASDAVSSYFILKTGAGEYEDAPAEEYHFKEGIPGSKQLRDAAGDARFVYLEDKAFYATGEIGEIRTETRDGTTHYFASIEGYEEIEPVSFGDVRDALSPTFPIQYGIIKIDRADYERIVFGEYEPEFEPVEGYDSVSAASEDIQERLDRLGDDRLAWFRDQFAESVVEDWTQALQNLEPGSVVDGAREVRFDQIRGLYTALEGDLTELAEEINAGSLNQLSAPKTVFMVLLRQVQSQAGLQPNANQVKLGLIFEEKYEASGVGLDIDHPLLTYLDEEQDALVHRFTAPPEYWLTSVRTGTIGFGAPDRDDWAALSPGDVVLFYSQQTDLDIDEEFPHGFIGAGIVNRRGEKPDDEAWWWDEYHEGASSPLLVSFDAVYLTGDAATLEEQRAITAATSLGDLPERFEALTADLLEYETAVELCESQTGDGVAVSGTTSPFLDGDEPDYERPRVLIEAMASSGLTSVPPIDLSQQFVGELDTDRVLEGLHFEDGQGREIVQQIESALRAGKHIVFTGPPGTGKTEVARRVANHLVETNLSLYTDSRLTTATADWSTFDTVGGYMPNNSEAETESLEFSPGAVLNRLKRQHPDTQRNEPLIIDELNRADIDKAFGQLFTLLSGQSVQLPFRQNGREVELLNASNLTGLPATHQYVVPASWRIFATMNTYDKTSLYEMSYAFMRRFAFIRIAVPTLPSTDEDLDAVIQRYVAVWEDVDPTPEERLAVGRVWRATNTAVDQRSIGPAIVADILRYIEQGHRPLEERLTDAVVSFVFPQLEGVPKRRDILNAIADVPEIDAAVLERAGQDMLQIESLDHA